MHYSFLKPHFILDIDPPIQVFWCSIIWITSFAKYSGRGNLRISPTHLVCHLCWYGPSQAKQAKYLSLATEQDGWSPNWTWWFSSQSFLDSFTIKTTSRVSSGWRDFVGNRTFFCHQGWFPFYRFLLLQWPFEQERDGKAKKVRRENIKSNVGTQYRVSASGSTSWPAGCRMARSDIIGVFSND